MILWGGAGINCDVGIEFSSVRFLLSSVPLRNSNTRRAVFLFPGIHAPTIVALTNEVPTTSPGSGGPRHGNNPETFFGTLSGTPLRGGF